MNWRFAKYGLGSNNYLSRSSTSALFSELGQDSKVLIICGVSLMRELDSFEQVIKMTYSHISSEITSNVKKWILRETESERRDELSERMFNNAKIAVAPNKGTFVKKEKAPLTLDIDTNIFGYYVFFQIVNFLKENDTSSESVTIYLDLTHGINYMSIITYDVTILAAAFHASLTGKKVRVEVMNSDPYPSASGRGSNPPELNINHIRTLDFDRKMGVDHILFTINTNLRKLGSSGKNPSNDDLLKLIIALKYSTENGFITLLDAMSDKIKVLLQDFETRLDKIEFNLEKLTFIHVNGHFKTSVKEEGTGTEWLAAHSLVRFLVEFISPRNGWRTFKEIREITDSYVRSASIKSILRTEMSNISGRLGGFIKKYQEPNFPVRLYEVLGECLGNIEVRNLTAHGGMERNISMIQLSDTIRKGDLSKRQWKESFEEKTEIKCDTDMKEIIDKIGKDELKEF